VVLKFVAVITPQKGLVNDMLHIQVEIDETSRAGIHWLVYREQGAINVGMSMEPVVAVRRTVGVGAISAPQANDSVWLFL
jgi:hypothetical protein